MIAGAVHATVVFSETKSAVQVTDCGKAKGKRKRATAKRRYKPLFEGQSLGR